MSHAAACSGKVAVPRRKGVRVTRPWQSRAWSRLPDVVFVMKTRLEC